MKTLIALLHGPDQKGLVARTAGWIFERGGNIIHADQHRDAESGIFFQRIEWQPANAESEASDFAEYARQLGMNVQIADNRKRARMAVFVSKIDHCFHDILLRWRAGEFNCDIPLVISNHPDMAEVSALHGIPYHTIPVSRETKASAEAQQVRLLEEARIDLIVMARYMQILSADFLRKCDCPVINIHHSFLPAFAGARPYHQAYKRGVKVIGATAHYATADLDEGPIIQQEVAHVNHRHNVEDLVRKGRDLEKTVLAQAVRWHLQNRVLAYANKTVVFD